MKRIHVLALTILMAIGLIGCSGSGTQPTPSAVTTPTVAPAVTSAAPVAVTASTEPVPTEAADLFLAPYDEQVHITSALRSVPNTQFAEGKDYTNNVWTEIYKDRLNITWEYIWEADANAYNDRLNLAITSNEIPDVMRVYDPQVAMMLKGGMLYDLTEVFETWTSPLTKDVMLADNGVYMAGGYQDGKLVALPFDQMAKRDQSELLWIRKDWLENVGMEAPKTKDEFLALCDAFLNNDPNKNGKNDTYSFGLGGQKNLIKDWGSLRALFMMWDVQPGLYFNDMPYFEIDANGEVIWSASKPAMVDALAMMQDMYAKGYLAKDFATMEVDVAMAGDLGSDKLGMFVGPDWLAGWPLDSVKENIPDSDWVAVPFPTATDHPTRIEMNRPNSSWTVISSKSEHADAIMKMLNLWCDISYSEDRAAKLLEIAAPPGVNDASRGTNMAVVRFNSKVNSKPDFYRLANAIKTNDPSGLLASQENVWQNIQTYLGDNTFQPGWTEWFNNCNEEGHVLHTIYEVMDDSLMKPNAYMGLMTDNMSKTLPQYKKMAEELIASIITGNKQPEDWMTFINETWPKLGGDAILEEVKAYVVSNK